MPKFSSWNYFLWPVFSQFTFTGQRKFECLFALQNFSYDSYNNIPIQASLEVALEDTYFNIVDPAYFDRDHTTIFVEPNEGGDSAIFGKIKVIKLADPEIIHVSLVFLIIFHHYHLYVG